MPRTNDKERNIQAVCDEAIADFLEATNRSAEEFEEVIVAFSQEVLAYVARSLEDDAEGQLLPDLTALLEAWERAQFDENDALLLFEAAQEEVEKLESWRYSTEHRTGRIPKDARAAEPAAHLLASERSESSGAFLKAFCTRRRSRFCPRREQESPSQPSPSEGDPWAACRRRAGGKAQVKAAAV